MTRRRAVAQIGRGDACSSATGALTGWPQSPNERDSLDICRSLRDLRLELARHAERLTELDNRCVHPVDDAEYWPDQGPKRLISLDRCLLQTLDWPR